MGWGLGRLGDLIRHQIALFLATALKRLSTMNKERTTPSAVVALAASEKSILCIRGVRIILSADLASFYDVEVRSLNQAVKRNIERFPTDFMFAITTEEWANLKSQNVISSWGGARTPPLAFTELGVAMLSSVLRSDRAIQVNIQIMRAFVDLRRAAIEPKDLAN
jgi:hypothetical protein